MTRTLPDLSFDEVSCWLVDRGVPRYRAEQLWHGVYGDLAPDYESITTLPAGLRQELHRELPLDRSTQIGVCEDRERRVRKLLLELEDGETIEAVLMHYDRRHTACLSCQVGCPVGCTFCATGLDGFVRNLSTGEIVSQALRFARELKKAGKRLSNIVYMGMGEPLLNYDATLKSVRILNDARGFALGIRSFTLSTAGVVPGIRRLEGEDLALNLAVSLHTVDDGLRERLVPLAKRYPVKELLSACRSYVRVTNRRVTFEVALLRGINDARKDAHAMAARLSGLLCHVNLIPGNAAPDAPFAPSERETVDDFARTLTDAGIPTTVRVARGQAIEAGCGQLRRRRS
ncbi:MAG: 23S rRNA (adenine(2503)-C(2))-methyltransferase RlmN [Candidatus Bipolaricaulota bacterium]|nr:MAG: 23S rRNA (adenine(2503)-C(2))-methyltransferase RlmN [Candidatus Bipolaricaulota bacterium]